MTNLRRCLLCALAGAGLALALASFGCATTAPIKVMPETEVRTAITAEMSAFKTDIGAKIGEITAEKVDASTTNFDRKALYLLILCCFSPLKSVWRVVKEWKAKRNGG